MLDQARALENELIRLRRDIHQHPELGFREFRTAALVADTLEEVGGIEIKTGIGKTGVVGQIGTGDGPTIAIRADMDALPILEQSERPYRSTNDGVMHACGHDAHTAMLLGAAHLLKQSFLQGDWRGNVRFLFQPSEEAFDDKGVSGATAMIEDGALAGVDAVIALHLFSDLPAGACYFEDGYSLAAVDSFQAWIRATGGHGAYPHYSKDPLFILGPVLSTIYGIPSRRIDPLRQCVISLGQVHAGSASNVIPGEVYLEGTIRSYEPAVRERLWAELENALRISEVMGGAYELKLHKGYPALHNDARVNEWVKGVAGDLLGQEKVQEVEFGMGAEDFAYMALAAKGAMFVVGAAIPDGVKRNHHTNTFDIDESALPIGAAVLAETARRFVTGQLGPAD
jgi:amidohydrolase